MTRIPLDVTLRLLQGEPGEMARLQQVLEAAPAYAERITGGPPGAADAQSTYSILPPGKGYEDKFVFGIYRDEVMVGCADVIRGYPDAQTVHVGLLLVAEAFQRQGVGRAAYAAIEDFMRAWGPAYTRVRIGVVGTNADVTAFWRKLGFRPTGEVKPYRYANVASETTILVKPLHPA